MFPFQFRHIFLPILTWYRILKKARKYSCLINLFFLKDGGKFFLFKVAKFCLFFYYYYNDVIFSGSSKTLENPHFTLTKSKKRILEFTIFFPKYRLQIQKFKTFFLQKKLTTGLQYCSFCNILSVIQDLQAILSHVL